MEKTDLLRIDPRDYDDLIIDPGTILRWFEVVNGYWVYQGLPSPGRPHVELVSGACSNGYFNVPELLKYPNVAEILGRQLGRYLKVLNVGKVDWVVSSAYAAITFGHEVAKELGAVFQNTEKDPKDDKKQLWRRMTIPAGARVLQAEELITHPTTGTTEEVRRAVTEGNAESVSFIDIVGVLVLRPEKLLPGSSDRPAEYNGRPIAALVEKEIQNFSPVQCPYCAVGSPRYRPKTHWVELTGKG